MSNLSLDELCNKCNVKCKKCLDTGKLWTPRKHWTAQLDGGGKFDLFRCNICSDGHWYSCSHTSDIYERNIKIFHYDDKNENLRIQILQPIYLKLMKQEREEKERLEEERLKKEKLEREEKEKLEREEKERVEEERLKKEKLEREEKERLEEERLKKEKLEREEKERVEEERLKKERLDREEKERLEEEKLKKEKLEREEKERVVREEKEQLEEEQLKKERLEEERLNKIKKIKEDVEKQMNDSSDKPVYGNNIINIESTKTEHLTINVDLGKLIDKVTNAVRSYGGDLFSLADLIKDIKIDMDMKSEEEHTEKTKCYQSYTSDMYPIYFFMIIIINKKSSSCNLLEWCGFSKQKYKITVRYTIMFPKNNVAKKVCEDANSSISELNLQKFLDFIKK